MNAPFKPQTPLLDLDLLKTLVAIAETGNFSAAAEVVFRTPSAVSMQVKRIEEMLGSTIFNRDSRSVTLTDDGEFLLSHARRALALNQQVVAKFITPEVNGTVHLGASDYAVEHFLPKVLRRFAETHPGVVVDVSVAHSDNLHDDVARGALDLVVLTCSAGSLKRENVEYLFDEKLVWAGLKGGIAAEQTPLPVSVWEEGCVWRKMALGGLEKAGRDYRITFKSAHVSGQKAGVMADMAVAPLPIGSCTGQIVPLDESNGLPPLGSFAVGMEKASDLSAPAKALAEHLRASLMKD